MAATSGYQLGSASRLQYGAFRANSAESVPARRSVFRHGQGLKKFADTEDRAISARSAGLSSLFSAASVSIGTKNSCACGSWCLANPL